MRSVLPFYRPDETPVGHLPRGTVKQSSDVLAFAPEGLVTNFAVLHPVLAEYLATATDTAPERPVIRSWSRRDPVDAALDARLLWQRLRHDGAQVDLRDVRFEVIRTQRDWTSRYPPAVYLLAAERLSKLMDRWADAVLADVIKPSHQLSAS